MAEQTSGDPKDLVQIGATEESRELLAELQTLGHIDDLMDGYRLAIALAVGLGREPRSQGPSRKTMFAAGNLDPDGAIKATIVETSPEARAWPYRAAEDLAEQGLEIIRESLEDDALEITELVERVEKANSFSRDDA